MKKKRIIKPVKPLAIIKDDSLFIFSATINRKIDSIANQNQHWRRRKKVFDAQALWVEAALLCQIFEFCAPAEITLTRIAPRALDFDNLVYAFKHIRDVIADTLLPGLAAGRADDDKRLQWQYCQEKGRPKEYAFRISIKRL